MTYLKNKNMRNFKINNMNTNGLWYEETLRNKDYFLKVIKEVYNTDNNNEWNEIDYRMDLYNTFDYIVEKQYKDKTFLRVMFGHKGDWDEEETQYISLPKKEIVMSGYCKCIKCESKQQKLRPINKDMDGWEREYHKCCFFDYIKYSTCNENYLKKYKYRDLNIH